VIGFEGEGVRSKDLASVALLFHMYLLSPVAVSEESIVFDCPLYGIAKWASRNDLS
jgi:hypothetical protein